MKISYLCLRPPLDPTQAATGNQVRDAGLCHVLRNCGHDVVQVASEPSQAGVNRDPEEFSRAVAVHLDSHKPEAIIVGYWTLLADLPETNTVVILDFIAPRLLEAMFQEGGVLQQESQAILKVLPRADHFLVGNQRQADLLLPLLLLAGFDCRARAPISIVPISTSGIVAEYQPPASEIRLISAGVDWPWRQSAEYFAVLETWCKKHPGFAFQNITGSYPGAGQAKSALLSYEAMQQQFAQSHIGLEVSARNVEREFSHSFRIIEYLQCGMPVIANSWLPIAPLLHEFDAGWLIETPEQLAQVLEKIEANPGILGEKAAGAKRLADTCLNYRYSSAPLLQYLAAPWQPVRPKPEIKAPVSRWWKIQSVFVQFYQLVFCRHRPPLCKDILVVTRSDLFPVDHGAAVKIVRTAEALSRHGGRVWLCTDNRRDYYLFEQGSMTVQKYPLWLRLLALPRRVALLRLLLKGYPWSNAFLYFPLTDASYITRALYLATRNPVGAFIAEFPAYVRPCRFVRKLLGGKVMLVEHNVEYARLKEQIKTLSERSFEELKRTELFMCNAADVVVTVSDNDRAILMRDGIAPQKIRTIPHGVDVAAFHNARVDDVRSLYGIAPDALLLVYHGPYSYAPNLQAMQVMATEILPRLLAQNLKVEVLAIGSKPPAEVLHDAIHFTGAVPDLTRILPAADIAVVPLLEGGGTRMKILDYFAAGVPVISTGKGVEGIPVIPGQHLVVADDIDDICAAIMEFAANPAHGKELARKAAAFVQELSWDNITALYMPLLQMQQAAQQ
jgi:glycosyltransferase involved in cell wall biosynthesis